MGSTTSLFRKDEDVSLSPSFSPRDDSDSDEEHSRLLTEAEYIASCIDVIQMLVEDVDRTPNDYDEANRKSSSWSFVIAELKKVVRTIGLDGTVTSLYKTITNESEWLAATAPYTEPAYEHAMFGVLRYTLDCPLDRMVYSIMVSQSLTVMYDTYKHWLTEERRNVQIPSYIGYIQQLRRCLQTRYRCNDKAKVALREIIDFTARNAHIVLHAGAGMLLQKCNPDDLHAKCEEVIDVLRRTGHRLIDVGRRAKERFVDFERLVTEDPPETDSSQDDSTSPQRGPIRFTRETRRGRNNPASRNR